MFYGARIGLLVDVYYTEPAQSYALQHDKLQLLREFRTSQQFGKKACGVRPLGSRDVAAGKGSLRTR